jgi:hypothetical protein
MGIKRVQISDFEDSVILPPGKYLRVVGYVGIQYGGVPSRGLAQPKELHQIYSLSDLW